MDDEEVQLAEGMPVENADGEKLGTLGALLIEEGEEDAEFLVLRAGDADRLVPFEAVMGVGDGALVLDVPAAALARFPEVRADADPTEDEMQRAYEVFDEGAAGEDAEDPDEP